MGPTSPPPSMLLCIFVFTALTSLASYISTPLSSPPKLAWTSCPGHRPCRPASPWGTTAGSLHRRSTRQLPSDRRPHRIPAGRCPPRHRLPSGGPRSLQTATRGKALAAHDISTSVWRGSWLRDVLCRCDIMGAADGAINVCFEGAEDLPGGGGGDYKRTMSSQRNPRQMTRRRTRRWISQQRSARLLTTPVTRMTDIHKELGEFTRTTRRQHMAGFCVHTPGQMVNITWGDILQEHNKGIFDMEFEDLDGDEDNLGQEGTKILFGGKYLCRET